MSGCILSYLVGPAVVYVHNCMYMLVCIMHSLCGFGSVDFAWICGLINNSKADIHTNTLKVLCAFVYTQTHCRNQHTRSLRMIDVLHVGPVTLCHCNIYYQRPSLALYYMSDRKQSRRDRQSNRERVRKIYSY